MVQTSLDTGTIKSSFRMVTWSSFYTLLENWTKKAQASENWINVQYSEDFDICMSRIQMITAHRNRSWYASPLWTVLHQSVLHWGLRVACTQCKTFFGGHKKVVSWRLRVILFWFFFQVPISPTFIEYLFGRVLHRVHSFISRYQ